LRTEGFLLGETVGVAAEVAPRMWPAHLAVVEIEMAVAVPAVGGHDPRERAEERREPLAIAMLGHLNAPSGQGGQRGARMTVCLK